ncbi:MAG: sugar phosphate isomerase/epimerase family protein [Anaerolineae bacterium]
MDAGEAVWRGSDYVNSLARDYRLPIRTVHQALFRKRWRGVWAGWILEAVDLALRVSAQHVVIHGPETTSWESPLASRWLLTLEMALRRLNGSGIRIALENDNWHSAHDKLKVLANLPDLVAFADKYDLDLTYDTCHTVSAGVDVLDGWTLVSPRVANIHLSDYKPGSAPFGSSLLRSLFRDHQLPGKGALPLAALMQQLRNQAYSGALTMEVSPTALICSAPFKLRKQLSYLVQFGIS